MGISPFELDIIAKALATSDFTVRSARPCLSPAEPPFVSAQAGAVAADRRTSGAQLSLSTADFFAPGEVHGATGALVTPPPLR